MIFFKNKKKEEQPKQKAETEEPREVHTSCEGCTNQDVNFCTDCNAENGYKWYIT